MKELTVTSPPFLQVAEDLEMAGLLWKPEIGDEVSAREQRGNLSILVDPHGMTPDELRATFIWLPTVEQMVFQFEARQAVLEHAGFELSERTMYYRTVVRAAVGQIESRANSLRTSVGLALRNLLLADAPSVVN